jgi:hypothetical protein
MKGIMRSLYLNRLIAKFMMANGSSVISFRTFKVEKE